MKHFFIIVNFITKGLIITIIINLLFLQQVFSQNKNSLKDITDNYQDYKNRIDLNFNQKVKLFGYEAACSSNIIKIAGFNTIPMDLCGVIYSAKKQHKTWQEAFKFCYELKAFGSDNWILLNNRHIASTPRLRNYLINKENILSSIFSSSNLFKSSSLNLLDKINDPNADLFDIIALFKSTMKEQDWEKWLATLNTDFENKYHYYYTIPGVTLNIFQGHLKLYHPAFPNRYYIYTDPSYEFYKPGLLSPTRFALSAIALLSATTNNDDIERAYPGKLDTKGNTFMFSLYHDSSKLTKKNFPQEVYNHLIFYKTILRGYNKTTFITKNTTTNDRKISIGKTADRYFKFKKPIIRTLIAWKEIEPNKTIANINAKTLCINSNYDQGNPFYYGIKYNSISKAIKGLNITYWRNQISKPLKMSQMTNYKEFLQSVNLIDYDLKKISSNQRNKWLLKYNQVMGSSNYSLLNPKPFKGTINIHYYYDRLFYETHHGTVRYSISTQLSQPNNKVKANSAFNPSIPITIYKNQLFCEWCGITNSN